MDLSRSGTSRWPVRHPGLVAATASAAATALWVQWRARRAEREHPPIGQFMDVNGVRLHYVDRGEGPAVVLLHGITVLMQDFIASGLVDALAQRYRVIAFDRPGYGHSERPRDRAWTMETHTALMHRAIVRLGIEPPVVLGHSWGALLGLSLGLAHPDKVRGLALAAGYYYPTARAELPLLMPTAVPVLGDVMRYTISPVLGRLLLPGAAKAMFWPNEVPGQFFEMLPKELMVRPGPLRANAEDAAELVAAAARLRHRYRELGVPARIVTGADDQIVDPQAHSERLHRELPRSELTVVPTAGHMVHYAAPRVVVAAVDALAGVA